MPLADATIPVMDRGFLFGDGVYEVTAVIEGRLVDDAAHLARLDRSLREIGISNPFPADDWRRIEEGIVRRNALRNGLIYIQVSRGVAERAFKYPDDLQPTVVMFPQFSPVQDNPLTRTGARIMTLPDLRWARCDIKSTSLLAQVLAKRAAAEAGMAEAWMTRGDTITEGASSTAYIVTQDGAIITRSLSHEILPGITRRTILRIAGERGLRIVERPFTRDEALTAAEAFYTSASTIAIPVVDIDGHAIGPGRPGPVFTQLYTAYMDAVMALTDVVI
ncbi:branched-chain amino acid aminotransferase [Neoasaia chiangmaiensis NBRC 101099]|uniref:Probable branched-chain-amino-acid aminotransferase n=2 Tax=Neoasaia chiangmaiensis TaxID=320497 RepID=A0A1U9KUK8_9PROT|nr:D-amino acid aminotransferase [Neoasaia chiangmaiensis]GBR36707.1 branched-chain amino acid aminotransferase [Neoasaia chiangmaiensis NBRC 101099]